MADFFMPANCVLTGTAKKSGSWKIDAADKPAPNYLSRLFEGNSLKIALPAVPMQFSQLKTAADLTGDRRLCEYF
ncbi:hypothetical protein [Acinetobacter sp.]|uniref:hypothetical protein n=1 Tax=Acinetobacter sp. TaxID=472 RepID=UPI002FC92982